MYGPSAPDPAKGSAPFLGAFEVGIEYGLYGAFDEGNE